MKKLTTKIAKKSILDKNKIKKTKNIPPQVVGPVSLVGDQSVRMKNFIPGLQPHNLIPVPRPLMDGVDLVPMDDWWRYGMKKGPAVEINRYHDLKTTIARNEGRKRTGPRFGSKSTDDEIMW